MDTSKQSYDGSYDGRISAVSERLEVDLRPELRRQWGSVAKLAIVRETLAAGSTAQRVAERRGIGTGLIYTWRKQMLHAAMARFAAAGIQPATASALPNAEPDASQTPPPSPVAAEALNAMAGVIEVGLPSGVRLRLGPDVDGNTLQRVLGATAAP